MPATRGSNKNGNNNSNSNRNSRSKNDNNNLSSARSLERRNPRTSSTLSTLSNRHEPLDVSE